MALSQGILLGFFYSFAVFAPTVIRQTLAEKVDKNVEIGTTMATLFIGGAIGGKIGSWVKPYYLNCTGF